MRALQVVVLALGVLWGGYWLAGSIALQKAAEGWFQAQVAAGRSATNSGVEVHGFPNRFDLTVTNVHLADPVTGLAWDAPFAQVFSMTWKPWHLIAALPQTQTFTLPDQTIALASAKLQGSLVLVPGTALALNRVVIDGADLAATSSSGWSLRAKRVELATRQDASAANGHEISLTVTDLIPDPALLAAMAATSDLPAVVEAAGIDGVAAFSAPLDRFAGSARPQLLALTIKSGTLRWGDMVLTGKGKVVADAEGLAEGQIDLSLQNWRKILPPAVALRLITPEVAPTVERVMEALARQSGDPSVLDLPLVMKAGRMSLGPIPLGPAPRMTAGPAG
jgi:hypothetical protein